MLSIPYVSKSQNHIPITDVDYVSLHIFQTSSGDDQF